MYGLSKVFYILLIVLGLTNYLISETVLPLFSTPPLEHIQKSRDAKEKAYVAQSRFVNIDTKLLFGDKPASKIALDLFKKHYIAKLEKISTMSNGGKNWIGTIEGVKFSQVIFTIKNGVLAGKISMPEGIYQVQRIYKTTYVLEDINQSAFPKELKPIPSPESVVPDSNIVSQTARRDSCTDITILVAYSTEAKNAAGGKADIEALINLAVTETNKSYENSGLIQRIRLVHTMETNEAQNNFYNDLTALRDKSDNIFNAIDTARETYHADEVALIIESTQYCGLGFLDSNADTAFSVSARVCATGYYSFGHELGHNMGAHHDWYKDETDTHAHGFVNLSDSWRTIMAYNSLCSDNGKSCTRLQYWSNPDITYNNDPMGVSKNGPSNCVKNSMTPDPSTCKADNHDILNGSCDRIANFRVSPNPETSSFNLSPIMYLLQ